MKKNIKKSPGRPAYKPVLPKGNFTLADFCESNGVNPDTGKGKFCSKLTLIKWLDRDRFMTDAKGNIDKDRPRRNSLVILLDKTEEPVAHAKANKGLGRKRLVYCLRNAANATRTSKPTRKATGLKKAAKSTVNVPIVDISPETKAYEATKAELAKPIVITVPPVATITPATSPVTPAAPAVDPATAETTPATTDPVTA